MAVSVIPRPVLTGMQLGQQTGNLLLGEQAATSRNLVNAITELEKQRQAGESAMYQARNTPGQINAYNQNAYLTIDAMKNGAGGYRDAQGNWTASKNPYEMPKQDPYFRASSQLRDALYKQSMNKEPYRNSLIEKLANFKVDDLIPYGQLTSRQKIVADFMTANPGLSSGYVNPIKPLVPEEVIRKNQETVRQQQKVRSSLVEDIIKYLNSLAG